MAATKKSASLREQDPHLAREREHYHAPLPSREWIIEVLERIGVPVSADDLAEKLSITPEERTFFDRRLGAMVRDGQILINRRGAVCMGEKLALVKCRVEAHKDGFGFAIPLTPTGEPDFILYDKQMRSLMHGDTVVMRPTSFDKRGRREGQIVEITDRANRHVVARMLREHGVMVAVPEDRRISQPIMLEPGADMGAQDGQVVVVTLDSFPSNHRPAIGRVSEILGNYADSGMEIEIAVRKHHLPHVFSEEVLAETAKISDTVKKSDFKNRRDVRDLALVTIDGADSRDFDDAVFAEKIGRNFRLVVAIADVSHYVPPGSALDAEAYERGTSVYFPRRVIPMLPEKLSNGICSLNPEVERLCMVCDMVITAQGNVKSYEFYPAVMKSRARLTYDQVWAWLESEADHPLKKELDTLYRLYQILDKKRQARGAIEFETVETKMVFDEVGKIDHIEPVTRNDAHKLIEECMLAANVCAADFLLKNKHPALFRSHKGPTDEKLDTLREQLFQLGLSLDGGANPTPKDYAKLFSQIKGRPDYLILQVMLLRSMMQAVYEPTNQGHFGLAYEAYTHFTSPIRRYPDLLVHRAIKAVLAGKKYTPKPDWAQQGIHASQTERRAEEASRDVENWLKTWYMRDKVGATFPGTITGMAQFGLFVTLDDIYVEGLVHISELGNDYFDYRADLLAIIGEKSGLRFNMGDKVVVKVAQANLETSKIDLTLVSGGTIGKAVPAKNRPAHHTTAPADSKHATNRVSKSTAKSPRKSRSTKTGNSTDKTEKKHRR